MKISGNYIISVILIFRATKLLNAFRVVYLYGPFVFKVPALYSVNSYNASNHLASEDHLKNSKHFIWKNGNFSSQRISSVICNYFLEISFIIVLNFLS